MSQVISTDVEFLREVATRLREGKPFEHRDGGDYTLSSLAQACTRLEQMARHLERVPPEPLMAKLEGGLALVVRKATFFEDLPWDAYVENEGRTINVWADGWTEIEAIKKVIQQARADGVIRD